MTADWTDAEAITLPGGFECEGAWRRAVWLRPLVGRDEALLAELAGAGARAASVTALLARTMSIDGVALPAGPHFARALAVGDREAALLHLRRLTLGDRLSCVLRCSVCGEKLDLDVQVSDLLLPPYPHAATWHQTTIEDGREMYHVRFRLPSGADQESVASLAGEDAEDAEDAALVLLQRCVDAATDARGRPLEALPVVVRRRLSGAMADLDPQAEVVLDATCPECDSPFTAPFDAAQFLRQEMSLAGDGLFREVHLLALHYHWGEAEILGLTRQRRHRYLALLAETLSPGMHG
jgi:hypothetical protein